MRTILAALLASVLGVASLCAQGTSIQPLIQEGDSVAGVGLVTRIDNMALNAAGQWLVEADTDNPDTNADSVVLNSSGLLLQEGQSLSAPAGATLDSFDALTLNNLGESGWNFFLDGTSGFNDDSGIYFNTTLVIQESNLSTAAGFSPGTTYIGFFETKINDSRKVLVMASVDDPAISSSVDRALVILDLDVAGNLLGETVFAKEGDVLPGQSDFVADFETNPHNFAFNNNGDLMFIADLDGNTAVDHAIYVNMALIAQEGSPSPVAGRNWELLSSKPVALNNLGGTAFRGNLDGDTSTDEIIIANGSKLVQEGDSLPDISPFVFTSFGSGPLWISDSGDVLWYGDWDDPNTDVDTGLFLNDRLIVQEGVSSVGGVLIDSLRGIQDGYFLSMDGDDVMFEAVLDNGVEGAYLLEIGSTGFTLGDPIPGIAGMMNSLASTGGTPNTVTYYLGSAISGNTPYNCSGNLLDIGMANPRILGNVTSDANGDAGIMGFAPSSLSGVTIYLQAIEPTTCQLSNLVTATLQ
ncbi:MAG: hypothetical protein DWQ01_06550 [Planctomycetota bacterium]|nr:MAG: hypothetical protein DWQ01_06550 [Planctomycetota bacterium]